MVIGPVLTLGGLIALFVVLGAPMPDLKTTGLTVVILLACLLVMRASLSLGPMKLCWRCRGKAHVGGLLGGRRECPSCNGKGIRPRIGSGK